MYSNYTMESYSMINEMGIPDLLPDVIPKERRPSDPPEEPDIEFEEDDERIWWYPMPVSYNARKDLIIYSNKSNPENSFKD